MQRPPRSFYTESELTSPLCCAKMRSVRAVESRHRRWEAFYSHRSVHSFRQNHDHGSAVLFYRGEFHMRKTKIVCTIGPASSSEEVFAEMCRAGLNVARLNFSHGTAEHQQKFDMIRKVRRELELPIAIMLDTGAGIPHPHVQKQKDHAEGRRSVHLHDAAGRRRRDDRFSSAGGGGEALFLGRYGAGQQRTGHF